MRMKKWLVLFISLILAGLMGILMVGCGNESGSENETSTGDDLASETEFDADAYYAKLEQSVEAIQEETDFKPDITVVLGSGLGDFAEHKDLDIEAEIPYDKIPGFPKTTVKGHDGDMVFGTMAGKKLVILQGRVHYYEGYDIHDVVFPLRVTHMLGADTVIMTNSVGAINEEYRPGDFVVVEDQISDFVPSPLVGENISELGDRFFSMVDAFDPELRELVLKIGEEEGITVHSGVFIQVTGPQFESPAEIRMFRTLGADTVGMSTAVEVIAARHMGMRVCDINAVTNMAAGVEEHNFTHEEVLKEADKAGKNYTILLKRLIEEMK